MYLKSKSLFPPHIFYLKNIGSTPKPQPTTMKLLKNQRAKMRAISQGKNEGKRARGHEGKKA